MTPAVVFDLGKVLVDFDYGIAARRIAARSSRAPKDLPALLGSSPLLSQYESGQLSRKAFYQAVCEAIGFRGDLAEFSGFFADIFAEMPGTIELQAQIRRRGFKTYIFSNTNDLAVEHIRRSFPFFANFDGYIFSYEVKAMKPDPRIYEALEALSGKSGADILYLDDRPENIAGGLARGWRTILHESPEKSGAVLNSLGI